MAKGDYSHEFVSSLKAEIESCGDLKSLSHRESIPLSTLYYWRKKFWSEREETDPRDQRLKELEARVKQLEEVEFELKTKIRAFEDIESDLMENVGNKRFFAEFLIASDIPKTKACQIARLSLSSFSYEKKGRGDVEIEDELNALRMSHPKDGFDKYFSLIREKGRRWNRKRVWRIYRYLKMYHWS